MVVVRDIFRLKFGQSKEAVALWKEATGLLRDSGWSTQCSIADGLGRGAVLHGCSGMHLQHGCRVGEGSPGGSGQRAVEGALCQNHSVHRKGPSRDSLRNRVTGHSRGSAGAATACSIRVRSAEARYTPCWKMPFTPRTRRSDAGECVSPLSTALRPNPAIYAKRNGPSASPRPVRFALV